MHLRPSHVHFAQHSACEWLGLGHLFGLPLCAFFQCTLSLRTSPATPSLVDCFTSRSDIKLPRVHEDRGAMFTHASTRIRVHTLISAQL